MASIDERIVAMSFENTRFEANIATTLNTLGKLDKTIAQIGKVNGLASIETSASKITLAGPMSALDKLRARLGRTNAGTTFTDIEKASDKVTLSGAATATDKLQSKINHISSGTVFTDMEKDSSRVNFSNLTGAIDGIGSHMSTMSIAVGTALGNVAAKIATKGAQMVKSLALGPVIDGFHNYETQINAVQTILANTGLKGKAGLDQVKGALNDLNKYANLTVYNFSEMAKNIGTFTAAGVKLEAGDGGHQGHRQPGGTVGFELGTGLVSDVSAVSGYRGGQGGLQDWNSVVNAGMGGAVFQKALMNTAQAMGTVKKGAVEIDKATGKATLNGKSFRESITAKPGEKSWLTSDVLTKTLSQFTGDMTDAQLAADGFNASQIKAIQSQAKTAVNAATQIKTFTQLSQAVKEEVGSAWAGVFSTLFGDINQATTLFSGLHTFIENALTGPINNFNKILQEWAKLGGRSTLLDGLKTAFKDLQTILAPIKDAFREIFPPATAQSLLDLTVRFRDLMKHLQASPETVNNIRRTFGGLFAILHIGWDIIKTVAGAIGSLLGASKKSAGGILDFTAKIGDFLKKLNDTAGRVGVFKALFGGLVEALKHPLELLKKLGDAIHNLFSGAATEGAGKFSGSMDILHKALGPIGGILDGASTAWKGFLKILDKVKTAISPLLENIAGVFNKFGDILSQGIKTADYSKVFSAVNTVLIAGIFVAIKKALGEGVHVDFGGGVIKNLSETIKSLTGNLEKMQTAIHAVTLLAIAGAIAVLAVGIAALSQINPKKLTSALTAVAVGIGELVGAMAILTKLNVRGGGTTGAAFSILLIASAMTVLAVAVKLFASMSWDQLARGLTGVAGALVAVNAGTQFMNGPKLLVTAAALFPLAIALNILGLAVKVFATMSWEKIAKGLVGITGALVGIGLAMQLMPATLPLTGAGLILVSTGLVVLSGAVLAFGRMNFTTIAKGILAIAASLTVIALAMDLMPPTLIIQAAGLMLVAVAMTALTAAIGILGHMNVLTLVKGIVAMGGALVVLGLGLDAMAGALPGAAGLLLAAFALGVLVPVLGALGLMSWGVIIKGLAAIAATLTVLAVIGGLAAIPLIALGAAILVLGVGLAAVGAAVYLFAKGISLIGDNSGKAVAAIVAATTAFVISFPKMIIDFVKGLVTILGSVVELAPKIVTALVSIAVLLLDGITKLAPKIATTVGALIVSIITVLNNHAGQVIAAGFKLLLNLLSGIAKNIGQVTDKAVEVVTHFLRALGRNAPKLVASGVAAMVSFLRGITNHIPNIVKVVANLIATFVNSVARNIPKVVGSAGNLIASFIKSIAKQVPKIISAGTNIIVNFIRGVGNATTRIVNAAVDTATKFINALAKALVKLVNVGFNAIINFLNGIADAIRKHNNALYNAGWNVASAILEGMLGGLSKLAGKVISKIGDIASSIPDKFLKVLGISSPSKVMLEIGRNVMLGLAQGIDKAAPEAGKSIVKAANDVVDTAKSAFDTMPDALIGIVDTNPVITPVLDLSNVRQSASQLGDILKVPLVAATSTDQASAIFDQTQAAAAVSAIQAPVATTFNFEQKNYSPDPLSNIEIYRQTNNQLSRLKSLVGVT
jgi:phage-related protein